MNQPAKILVVDDTPVNVKLLADLLAAKGYAVVTASAGAEALAICKRKIDGAYGERFLCSLGLVTALVANKYEVRFVQFAKEAGVPFDASGWTCMVIGTMPIFHVSPDDLRASDVGDRVEANLSKIPPQS